MLEAIYPALSSTLGLWYGSKGEALERTGNRHGGLAEAPYNVYPTADGWVAIICVTDQHWRNLIGAMEHPDLADDARFGTLKERVANMDAVDELVSSWTRGFEKEALFKLLMTHRVPCAPVRELGEVVADPHLRARGAIQEIDHPLLGPVPLITGALRYGEDPPPIEPSKELGADNARVYGEWLGLGAEGVETLRAEGVI